MHVRFAVFIATSVDGFIARQDGRIDWLDPFHDEDHGYGAFFASVDTLVIGRGTYETVLGFSTWPYGDKRVIVCTTRPASPAHGEELWSGPVRALAERLDREEVRLPISALRYSRQWRFLAAARGVVERGERLRAAVAARPFSPTFRRGRWALAPRLEWPTGCGVPSFR
jgi:hypothetical protein